MTHCGKPAAYVVRNMAGEEWFVCEEHGDPQAPTMVPWIVRTDLEAWFMARSMPVPAEPRRVCNEARRDDAA